MAQSARRLRQARRQHESQPGRAMTRCIPRTCRLHPGATVVAIDYRLAVVGATSRQRLPWRRYPCWAKDQRSAIAATGSGFWQRPPRCAQRPFRWLATRVASASAGQRPVLTRSSRSNLRPARLLPPNIRFSKFGVHTSSRCQGQRGSSEHRL